MRGILGWFAARHVVLSFGGGELDRCSINETQEHTVNKLDNGMVKLYAAKMQLARTTSRISIPRLAAGAGVIGAFHTSLEKSAEVSAGVWNLQCLRD